MADSEGVVVTIDGPAGSGKGTVGQKLALRLGWNFLDSGALYRTCACIVSENSLPVSQIESIVEYLQAIDFRSVASPFGGEASVFLGGLEISERIRTPQCGRLASQLAVHPEIRQVLLSIQRNYNRSPGLVADGRDMGTVVFPDAAFKVFLTANLRSRAQRKYNQLKNQGIQVNYDNIYNEIRSRDERDSTRSHAPLTTPEGALTLDTSSMDADEALMSVLDGLNTILEISGETQYGNTL